MGMLPDDAAAERQKYLDEYGAALEQDKDEAITWRKTYEQRWIEAERQLRDGTTSLSGTKEQGGYMSPATDKPAHMRASDNITAPITRKIFARVSNMLFGTDEQQADIVPTPVPRPTPHMLEGLDPNDPEFYAKFESKASKSAAAMERKIKDYMAEANYSTQGRIAIKDGCEVGTGVIHGPFPKKVAKKISNTQMDEAGNPVTSITYDEVIVPSVARLDFRKFYPRPARNMGECEGVFLLDLMTSKRLRGLIGQPGFDEEQIKRILETDPNPGMLNDMPNVSDAGNIKAVLKGKYPMWKYIGPIQTKCLTYMDPEAAQEDNETIDGEVWFCQGITIKAVPTDGEALPFHVFNYREDPDSIFGFGVPHDISHDQFDRNLMWSAVKLNALASAFPIIGILKGTFETENGPIDYPLRKPIVLKSPDMDVGKCIQVETVPSTIGDAMLIYDRAGMNAENHAMVQPMEQSAGTDVKMGAAMFAMLKIEDNIIQADAAKNWDDNITKPLLTGFIDFELLHGDDKDCKWAFDVIPKASSHLLTKDILAQQALQVLMMAQNPANAPFYKMYELNKMVIDQTNLDADLVMIPKEQAEAMQQQAAQQPTPEQMAMEAEKYKVDKNFEAVQVKAQADIQIANTRAETAVLTGEMALEAASITAASDEVMTAQEQESRMRIAALSTRAKEYGETLKDQREREATASKTMLEAEKLASKEAGDMLEVQVEKTPRLA